LQAVPARPPKPGRLALTLTIAGLSLLPLASRLAGQGAEKYDTVLVDGSGDLRILTRDGRQITPPKDPNQVAVDKAAISPDHLAVGWLALFPNCCTSYPIPLKLVVYTRGRVYTFVGAGLPVWRWGFDSTSVARFEPHDSRPPPSWVRLIAVP
jgi:hypothetical protein